MGWAILPIRPIRLYQPYFILRPASTAIILASVGRALTHSHLWAFAGGVFHDINLDLLALQKFVMVFKLDERLTYFVLVVGAVRAIEPSRGSSSLVSLPFFFISLPSCILSFLIFFFSSKIEEGLKGVLLLIAFRREGALAFAVPRSDTSQSIFSSVNTAITGSLLSQTAHKCTSSTSIYLDRHFV